MPTANNSRQDGRPGGAALGGSDQNGAKEFFAMRCWARSGAVMRGETRILLDRLIDVDSCVVVGETA